ncbi:MAG: PxKF domain-containing protein, partial [Anaerolineae bacterium]
DSTPINMSGTGGKVALVNTTTPLGCNGGSTACSPAALATIVDLIGWDGANFFEGSAAAPPTTNSTADLRVNGGCLDTDNNSADFVAGGPTPRNTASPLHDCTQPTGVGAASPNTVFSGESPLLTVAAIGGINPPSTGLAVSCDPTAIGGSATHGFVDHGSNGDAAAGDNKFSFTATVASNTTSGVKSLPCTVTDAQGRSGAATISLTVTAVMPIGTVNGPVGDSDNGTTHISPFNNQVVTVQGVIYERTLQAITNSANSYKGFFLQNTTDTADTDPNTSDGIFVFMNTDSTVTGPGGLSYTPTVGDEVVLTGTVSEFFNMTELVGPLTVAKIVRSNVDIDAAVAPVEANPPASLANANRYWERHQGMRMQIPATSIVLGGRNVFSPADAEIWLARSDSTIALRPDPYTRRAFRDAHPLDDNYDPNNWDGNGYRMLIGSLGIKSAAANKDALIDPARTFDTLTDPISGGLNYTFSKYRVEISGQPTFAHGVDPAGNHPPQAADRTTEYSIVDYNVENLYDYRDNPFSGCDFTGNGGCPQVSPFLAAVSPPYDYVPASDAAYQARLADIASQIVNDLHSPDILMMQEVENQDYCSLSGGTLTCGGTDNADGRPDDLQDLALKIAEIGGPVYDSAFDRNSSDLRGIVPSFMYRTDRVELLPAAGDPVLDGSPAIDGYTAVPYDGDTSNPKSLNAVYTGTGACESSYVFPRALDVGLFRIHTGALGDSTYRDVYVLDNHFKSGPDTCVNHRKEQANYNAAVVNFLQTARPDANIVVGGDLNVYAHPDNNSLTAVDQLAALYAPSLGLKNLYEVELDHAPAAAYSYVFQGMAQTIDQIFVNQPMLAHLQDVRGAHINSDFPADNPGDGPRGTSDHDPTAARFLFDLAPVVGAVTVSPEPSTEGSNATASASFSDADGSGDAPFTCTVDYGDGSGALAGTVNGSTCSGPAHAYSTFGVYTVTVSVTDKFGGIGSQTGSHTVIFNFAGFFQPVDNLPVLNIAKAGTSIPVKFGLGGDKGLSVFAAGYPKSQPIACDSSEPTDAIESTATAGSSGLSYDPLTQTYTYIWKTDKSWANTCRQLTIKLVDGTTHQANFKFTR